jgi:hypothetical protein
MNLALVERIANAVLYEGYILYPYRPSSVKNRQRWTFGGIVPRSFSEAQGGSDAWQMQTECLVQGAISQCWGEPSILTPGLADNRRLDPSHSPQHWEAGGAASRPTLTVRVRFLHLLAREVGEVVPPLPALPADAEPVFRPVERLVVGGQVFTTWQEAVEREIGNLELDLTGLVARPYRRAFAFPARRDMEPLREPGGAVVGVLARRQEPVEGAIEVSATLAGSGLFKVTVRIRNTTPLPADKRSRDDALPQSFVSTHAILGVRGGAFVSLLDPPAECREAAAGCANAGAWPVLVGEAGERDTMLASPIILYDYPEIAPESPGDLFDGTEIDEILTLRILAMTDAEKQEMREADPRARALLDRTEALSAEQLMQLHGTMRNLRPLAE